MVKLILSLVFLALFALPSSALSGGAQRTASSSLGPTTLTMPNDQQIRVLGAGGQSNSVAAEPSDATLSNTWISSGDIVNVTTQRSSNETPEAQAARHAKLVKAMKKEFPSDPPSTH